MTDGRAAQRGFTLIELMIALIIASILLSVGVPTFSQLIKNNRLTAHANALAGTLNSARAESIAQRRTVTVCGSANGTACNGAWGSGWISFVDQNSDSVVDGGETVLRVSSTTPAGVTLAFVGATTVRYNSQGYLLPDSSGVLRLCDDRGDSYGKAVLVSATGRVSMATDTDDPADGIVDNAAGTNIDCP